MSLWENHDNKIPDYYKNMDLDGYTPDQILHALRKKMLHEYEMRTENKQAETDKITNIKIISEVRIR